MDTVFSVIFRLAWTLAPTALFAGVGWLSLKALSFGRYPRPQPLLKPEHWHDLDAVALLGAAEIAALVGIACWIHGST